MATGSRKSAQPRREDPRVVRSRTLLLEAGRLLFLQQGYAGTTMEEIAAAAGLTKRTIYNIFPDKEALFRQIVAGVTGFADEFVRNLREEFPESIPPRQLRPTLRRVAERLALAIVRPQVIELRRLLIGEAHRFPALAAEYLDRAPGQVLELLASRFGVLSKARLLRVPDPRMAAGQFAYLIVGEALDRAVLLGTTPSEAQLITASREAVTTFLARYGPT